VSFIEQQQLKDELSSLSLFIDSNIIAIDNIALGSSHLCYKVSTLTSTYFVQIIQQRVSQQAFHSFDFLVHVYQLGIAPKPLFSDQRYFITEFIEGVNLAQHAISTDDKVDITLPSLIKLHQSSFKNLPKLDFVARINELIMAAQLTAQQKRKIHPFVRLFKENNNSLKKGLLVPCHGDVNFANVLLNSNQPKDTVPGLLIDFEYVGLAELEFDLAMFIAINDLIAGQAVENVILKIAKQYQALSPYKLQPCVDKITNYLLLCFLMNGLWYQAKAIKDSSELMSKLAIEQFEQLDCLHLLTDALVQKMR